ncbi:MAG: bifunctional sugar-1-phosphate nucleotidylyltransferase/acetyltransferase [Candidatus Altiarchaeota archaeon]|nr:bifunctional sugar-1-phosphate nucleotidylyltransferase/acetyltransferase [Candidatus Altiarchaeota archaeon]
MDAVILAAGEGTRLRPLTSTRPKPMLPVAGKTILEWDLQALSRNGVSKALIVVGYKKEAIINYFGKRFSGVKLEYVNQKEQLGTAHAVSTAEGKVKNEFLVMNGDLPVSEKLITNFIRDHNKNKSQNSMCLVEVKDPSEFGIVQLKGSLVKKITEKPRKSKSRLANAGIYIFNEEIFNAIKKVKKSSRFEYELTDAIKTMIPHKKIHGFKAKDRWIDIGRPWDLLEANEAVLKEMKLKKDKGVQIEQFTVIKGEVHIGNGTLIKSGSYIEGPCYIGENCTVGPNCYIRPHSSIKDNVHIGNAVEIKNSIIMSGTNVGHLSYVGDSIIGEDCNFGAGTKVANLRVDDDEIKVEIKNKLTKSGRRKFGCLMGDNVKTGINVSIMPGRSIYPKAYVEAGSIVRNTIYSE